MPSDIDPQSGFRLPLPRREDLDDVGKAHYDRVAVRRPFELAVHLARGRQDRDLAHARRQTGLETQVTVEGARVLGRLRAVKPDPARALQPGDRGARSWASSA